MLRKSLIILLCLLPLFGFAQKKKKKKKDKEGVSLVDRVADLFGAYTPKDTLLIYKKEEDPADTIPDVPLRKRRMSFSE